MGNDPAEVAALAARFTLRKAEREGLERAARLYAERHILADESRPPARYRRGACKAQTEATRHALWVVGSEALRRQLTRYEDELAPAPPRADRARPAPPRNCRPARATASCWSDCKSPAGTGEVTSAAEERELLERLVEEGGNLSHTGLTNRSASLECF